MKKVLLTIITSLFILIPISINAERIECEYRLKSTEGDDYGTMTITKNSSGGLFINGHRVGTDAIELGKIQGNSTTLYYSASPNVGNFYDFSDNVRAAVTANYCDQLETCSNERIPNEPRGTTFNCEEKQVNDDPWWLLAVKIMTIGAKTEKKCVATNLKINNGTNYLNSVFNSSSCPSINYVFAYDKDSPGSKKYIVFLNPKEVKGTDLAGSLFSASPTKQTGGITNSEVTINNEIEDVPFCGETSGFLKVFKIIGYVIFVIKILVPIALIIFGSIDFFKAMLSSSDDAIKKATSTIIQRAIIAVAVFLIPTLVYYLTSLIGNAISRNDDYFQNCNTCLLKPDSCVARDREVIIKENYSTDAEEDEIKFRGSIKNDTVPVCSLEDGCSGCKESSQRAACEAAVRANQSNNN